MAVPGCWPLAALVPVGLTLGLTYTRLAWGAVVIGFLVMAWACGRRWLVPAALVLLLALAVVTPEVGHRLEQLTSSNAAVPGSESGISWRLGQWADVASLAGGNPITGIGPDVVPMRLANHQPPHNDYLRAFVEMGIVGLLAYLGLLAALVGVAISAQRRAQGPEARTIALAFVGVISAFAVASGAANLLGQVVLLWYVLALAAAAAWVARHRTADRDVAAAPRSPSGCRHEPGDPGRGTGGCRARAWRRWPIGLAVAAVTAVVGLAVTWESPQAYVSRATVFPPSSVTTAVAGQRYITDMQAAINSAVVREDVADDLGVSSSAFGDQVEVRRVRQSTVMEAVMRSPNRLTDAGEALSRLITRAGESLAAPDVAAAAGAAGSRQGQRRLRRGRGGGGQEGTRHVPAATAKASPRLRSWPSSGRRWRSARCAPPARSSRPGPCLQTASNASTSCKPRPTELAQADDELAALDRDLAQAESDVADAERDQRAADAAAARRGRGARGRGLPAGQKVSQALSLLRRSARHRRRLAPARRGRHGRAGPRHPSRPATAPPERAAGARARTSPDTVSKLDDPPDRARRACEPPSVPVSGRSEVVHVARGGGLNLAGSLINTISVLALFWVLDKNLGQTLTGVYIQAFALRRILQTIALGGMRSAMTRFVAIHLADDDDASLRGTIAVGIAISVGLATVLGIALFFAAPWLSNSVYGDPEMVAGLRWVAVGPAVGRVHDRGALGHHRLAHDAAQRHRRLDGRADHAGRRSPPAPLRWAPG